MFKNIRNHIKELAKTAVILAEETLFKESGKEKKLMAIEFIISNIPVISPFKKIIAAILSEFIDDSIEFAVRQMKTFATEI